MLLVRDQANITMLTASHPNPFFGLKTSQSTNTNLQVNQLLGTYPQFPNGNGSPGSGGVVEHNRTAVAKGLQFTVNYMRSKMIEQVSWLNPGDPTLERRISPFDRSNRITASGVYELPFGRGRRFDPGSGMFNAIAGGWKISGTYTYQTGGPFPWLNGSTNNPGDYVYNGAPLNLKNRSVDGAAFDRSGFKTLSAEQFQFHRRTFSTTFQNLRADGTNDLNLSLMKDFRIGEKVRFQLRCDAYNAVNHPVFGNPNTQVNNSQFGFIASQANRPRSMQFMGRMTF
jgi:hypothetical protein